MTWQPDQLKVNYKQVLQIQVVPPTKVESTPSTLPDDDDLANLVDRAEVVLQLQEEGGEEVGEQVDEVA